MTFEELRALGAWIAAELGEKPMRKRLWDDRPGYDDRADFRRLFPLLVDLAEAHLKAWEQQPYGDECSGPSDALRAAMNPPPKPEPCPVCGDDVNTEEDAFRHSHLACLSQLRETSLLCSRGHTHSGDHCVHSHHDGRRIASWPQEER